MKKDGSTLSQLTARRKEIKEELSMQEQLIDLLKRVKILEEEMKRKENKTIKYGR